MKNSRQYSEKVHKLYSRLKSQYGKLEKVQYKDVLEAMVYGIISEHITVKQTESAFGKLSNYFVDFNDLRVSGSDEITEVLCQDKGLCEDIASRLTASLDCVFKTYHNLSLENLRGIGKREAKQILKKIEGVSCFVVDYCMLTSLGGHAIPLTANTIDYLKSNELVHPASDQQEIQGFLARQISARDAYQFYAFLRADSESGSAGVSKRKKTVRKPKTKKKSKKRPKTETRKA